MSWVFWWSLSLVTTVTLEKTSALSFLLVTLVTFHCSHSIASMSILDWWDQDHIFSGASSVAPGSSRQLSSLCLLAKLLWTWPPVWFAWFIISTYGWLPFNSVSIVTPADSSAGLQVKPVSSQPVPRYRVSLPQAWKYALLILNDPKFLSNQSPGLRSHTWSMPTTLS